MLWTLLLSLLWFTPDSASSASLNTAKVQLTLYYESLCPDCQSFIKQQLFPTYQKIGEIFNLTLVPYGNAEERKSGDEWIFYCQHGQKECEGNIIETCAISLIKSFNTTFHFVHCFEEHIGRTQEPSTAAEKCAQQLGVDYAPIEDCHKGPLGNKLEHEMAVKTDALQPSHEYVPWVTLNGKHTENIQRQAESHLLKLICSYYTGPKPEACERQQPVGRCYRNSLLDKF